MGGLNKVINVFYYLLGGRIEVLMGDDEIEDYRETDRVT